MAAVRAPGQAARAQARPRGASAARAACGCSASARASPRGCGDSVSPLRKHPRPGMFQFPPTIF